MTKPQDEAKPGPDRPEGARRADALETGVVASKPVDTGALVPSLKAELSHEPNRANALETSVIGSTPLAGAGQRKDDAKPAAKAPPLKLGQPVAGAKPADAKPADSKPADPKPAEPKADKSMPSEPKPATPFQPATAKAQPMTSEPESKASDTKPADVRPAPRPVTVKKVGFFPLVLGGMVAAGLGAGAAYYAIPNLPPQWQPVAAPAVDAETIRAEAVAAAQDAARVAAAEAAQASLADMTKAARTEAQAAGAEAAKAALADLPSAAETRADDATFEAAPEPVDLTPLQDRLDQQAAQIKALDEAIAALGGQEGAPLGDAAAPSAAVAGLEAAVAQMQEKLAAQSAELEALAARPEVQPADMSGVAEQIEAAAAEAEARIRAAEEEAAKLREDAAASGQTARAAAALALLQSAMETGAPRDNALAGLEAAGVTVPPALTADVPTLTELRSGFPAASRAALAASLKAGSANESAMGKVANFLKVQTGARSVAPQEGGDPDAILSRAEARVQAADVAGALEEIAALPQAGQDAPAMAAWVEKARAHTAAQAAVADLSRDMK